MNRFNVLLARDERGFSLVELMTAITISMILLSGVVQVFLANKQAFKLQQGSSRAQESGRTGVFILARTIREAGYYRFSPDFKDFAESVFTAAAPRIQGTDGGGSNPDTLTIRYQGHTDGAIVDCLGRPVTCLGNTDCIADPLAHNLTVTNVFALSSADPVTGVRSLTCARSIPDANPAVLDSTPNKLIEGVTDFQVMYGVDTNDDSTADQYVDADDVTDWALVKSVQISMIANSVEKVDAGAATGKMLTQTYTQTIELRNL